MPAISNDLMISPSQAGSIFLFASVGVAIGSLSSGFVSSKINHKGSLVASILGSGIVLMACAFLSNLLTIQLAMTLLGVTAGLNLPSNMAILTATVNRPDWGKAMAVQQTGPPLSLILGPLLSALLLPWMSWRLILACLAVFTMGTALFLILFGKFGDFPGDPPNASNVKLVISKKSFWIMIALFALGIGGHVGIYTMIPLYLITEQDLSPELANTIVGLSQVSTFFMTFFSGWVTDRLHEKPAIALFLLLSGGFTILLGVLSGTWLKVIIFIQPAMAVCFFPAAFASLSRIVHPNLRSLATSWATPIAFTIGAGIFPVALGYMGQRFSFGLGISIAGLIIMLGSLLVIFLELSDEMEEGC
ncbi:MFS transporter [Deltaproteobacteria bacterium]|nr:MFS transporter [Deltaproteobacteria bacterium]